MQHPDPHPPAVVCGLPKAAVRFGLRSCALPLAIAAAIFVLVPLLIVRLPARLMIVVIPLLVVLPAVVAYALMARSHLRFRKLVAGIATNPLACLNCTYPTIDPSTRVCPECGHHTDRDSLNRFWRRTLERRAQKIRAAAEWTGPLAPPPP